MVIDKAIDSTEFDSKLTTVADAIRTAGGTTDTMSFPTGMVDAISSLSSGGGGTEELSALLKIFGCSDYEISIVQRTSGTMMYVPVTNETLKSSLRLIFIPGTDSLFPTHNIKKAPILRAPSVTYIYGFFAYMLPFGLPSYRLNTNISVSLGSDDGLRSFEYNTSNSFTQDGHGFVFENNILQISLGIIASYSDANTENMMGKKVLLMGENVQ